MEEVSPTTETKQTQTKPHSSKPTPTPSNTSYNSSLGPPKPPPTSSPPNSNTNSNSNSNSGFKLYQRRSNNHQQLQLTPPPIPHFNSNSNINTIFSPRNTEILSPSVLDFPSLALSPVTPLIPDPFGRSGSGQGWSTQEAEDKATKEKGFYLHHSQREAEPPKLLPLFPTTSPRGSSSSDSC